MKWVMVLSVAGLLGLSLPASAQQGVAGIDTVDLRAYLGTLELEARLDADFTGDGQADVVYVAADRNERVLGILDGAPGSARIGARELGEGRLTVSPRSSVSLRLENDQLVVDQVVDESGVTVINYRFRYDHAAREAHLTELTAEQYSADVTQGTTRLHWNLDTGEYTTMHGEAVTLDSGQDVYVYGPENRTARPSAPVSLGRMPDPLVLLDGELKRHMVAASVHEGGSATP